MNSSPDPHFRAKPWETAVIPKILIVEDNDENRDIVCRRLARRGYVIVTATNGVEGFYRACTEKPDVILMDIGLPEMNGLRAINLLKQARATRGIPIIVLTAHILETDNAFEAGCDEFCSKPVDFRRLNDAIDHLLASVTR